MSGLTNGDNISKATVAALCRLTSSIVQHPCITKKTKLKVTLELSQSSFITRKQMMFLKKICKSSSTKNQIFPAVLTVAF